MSMGFTANNKAEIYSNELKKTFLYDSTEILSVEIFYPGLCLNENPFIQKRINSYFSNKAQRFYLHTSTLLRKNAIETYHYTQENNYPFLKYEAIMNYTITKNINSLLSVYFDQYEFTGGAHGNTLRSSVTWNLRTGKILSMSDLCNPQVVLGEILELARIQAKENPYLYFENYEELIINNFNEEHFYLTSKGISVFYQQYEIGPYVSGIIVFEVPCLLFNHKNTT